MPCEANQACNVSDANGWAREPRMTSSAVLAGVVKLGMACLWESRLRPSSGSLSSWLFGPCQL